jgi:hypothetical protein
MHCYATPKPYSSPTGPYLQRERASGGIRAPNRSASAAQSNETKPVRATAMEKRVGRASRSEVIRGAVTTIAIN